MNKKCKPGQLGGHWFMFTGKDKDYRYHKCQWCNDIQKLRIRRPKGQ